MITQSSTAASHEPHVDSEALAGRARELLPILRKQARRPYFVELAGTPKAGKTSTLQVVHRFLKDCGYQVHEMRERAADCPIAMKGHFYFNTWTTTTMLASMIESLETEADVVLLDRGVFDALVWLEAQHVAQQVSQHERDVFRAFVLLDRWRTLTDLTFVLRVDPPKAVERENAGLIVPRTGTIMGEGPLERYNGVLDDVRRSMGQQFSFVDVDTTALHATQTPRVIATALLEHMERWADPEIAAVPRSAAEQLFRDGSVRRLPDALPELERAVVFRRRSTLENDDGFVQIVSAAVLRHADTLLLLRRSEAHDEKRTTFGRDVLWKGCHVPRIEPAPADLLATASAALERRLVEDFHLVRLDTQLVPRFLVWNPDDQRDARHLGMLFDLEIPAPRVAESLAHKVFKRERDRTKLRGSRFVAPTELAARVDRNDDIELESWSREILRHMTGRSS